MPIQRKSAPAAQQYQSDDQMFAPEPDVFAADEVVAHGGWENAQKLLDESRDSSKTTHDFKFSEEEQLIAFLPGQIPLDSYRQHWVNRPKGKRSFVCLGQGCPLCRIGDVPSGKFAFAVAHVVLPEEGDVEVKPCLLIAGKRLMEMLYKLDRDPKRGPLAGGFFSVSRSGTGTSTSYSVSQVKVRDLEDDWGISGEDALEEIKDMTAADVRPPFRSTAEAMEEVAAEVMGQ